MFSLCLLIISLFNGGYILLQFNWFLLRTPQANKKTQDFPIGAPLTIAFAILLIAEIATSTANTLRVPQKPLTTCFSIVLATTVWIYSFAHKYSFVLRKNHLHTVCEDGNIRTKRDVEDVSFLGFQVNCEGHSACKNAIITVDCLKSGHINCEYDNIYKNKYQVGKKKSIRAISREFFPLHRLSRQLAFFSKNFHL